MATVEQLVDDQQSYAESLADEGALALRNAQSLLLALEPEPFEFTPVTPAPPPAFSEDEDIPDFDEVFLDLPPDVGVAPELDVATLIDTTGRPAPFAEPAPVLEEHQTPFPASIEAFAENIPTVDLNGINFPTPPAELLNFSIAAPSEPPVRAEPTSPGTLAVQHFDGRAPTDTLAAPDNYEARFATAYAGASPSMMAAANGYVDTQMAKINPQFNAQMSAIEAQPAPRDAVIKGLVEALKDTAAILQAALVAGKIKSADQYRIGGVYLQNVSDTLDAADAALAAAKAVTE